MNFRALSLLMVAICTERVEAKDVGQTPKKVVSCCNLHGACGGKGVRQKQTRH